MNFYIQKDTCEWVDLHTQSWLCSLVICYISAGYLNRISNDALGIAIGDDSGENGAPCFGGIKLPVDRYCPAPVYEQHWRPWRQPCSADRGPHPEDLEVHRHVEGSRAGRYDDHSFSDRSEPLTQICGGIPYSTHLHSLPSLEIRNPNSFTCQNLGMRKDISKIMI